MMMMGKANGPSCPECGCRHSALVGTGEWFSKPFEKLQCRHCARVWRHFDAEEKAPEYVPTRTKCKCGGFAPVTNSDGNVRYHKCEKCGAKFKTVEGG